MTYDVRPTFESFDHDFDDVLGDDSTLDLDTIFDATLIRVDQTTYDHFMIVTYVVDVPHELTNDRARFDDLASFIARVENGFTTKAIAHTSTQHHDDDDRAYAIVTCTNFI